MAGDFTDVLTASDSLLTIDVSSYVETTSASESLLGAGVLTPVQNTATATDTFSRANQSGWGTASDSEVWSVVLGGAGNFSIASNEGQITGVTAIQGAYLGTTTATDMEVLVRYTASATTDNVLVFLRGTASNTQYRIKQAGASFSINRVVAGTNTALQSATFTTTAAQAYWIRAVVEGGSASATLAAKTWQDGNAEPLTWNLSGVVDGSPITGAGQFGLGTTLTVTTDTLKYDTYTVAKYASADALVASDSLLKTESALPVEVNSASDALLGVGAGALVESLATSDSLFGTENILAVESIPASDLSGVLFRWPVDSLSATGSLFGIDISLPLNGLSGRETDLATTSYQKLANALLATDSASMAQTAPTIYNIVVSPPVGTEIHPPQVGFMGIGPSLPFVGKLTPSLYQVNGTALPDVPVIATTMGGTKNMLSAGTTLTLLFSSPGETTQRLLANRSTVSLTFPLTSGQLVTGTFLLASALSGSMFQVIATLTKDLQISTRLVQTQFN